MKMLRTVALLATLIVPVAVSAVPIRTANAGLLGTVDGLQAAPSSTVVQCSFRDNPVSPSKRRASGLPRGRTAILR